MSYGACLKCGCARHECECRGNPPCRVRAGRANPIKPRVLKTEMAPSPVKFPPEALPLPGVQALGRGLRVLG